MNLTKTLQEEVNRLLRLKSDNVKNALSNVDDEVAMTWLSELFKGNGWTVAFHTGARNHRSLLISDPKRPDTVLFIVKFIISHRPLIRDRVKDELTDFENNIGPAYDCGQFCIIAAHGYEAKAQKLEDYLLLEDWTYIEKLIADYSKDKKQEPRIQLFAHNEKTYKKVKKMMGDAKGVAVVQATGTGKSYLIAKLLQDFAGEKRLVMAPSYYIIDQIKEHIRWETDLPGEANKIEFMTYARSMNLTAAEIHELKPKMIVLDEFHRCGAEEWGRGVQDILNAYPQTFKFGTSATPIRYLDNGRDMSMELFQGHVAENLNLAQAIVRNILPMPKYVCALYTLSEEITSMRAKIAGSRKDEQTKRKLLLDLDAIHIDWERSRGIPHVLKKHLRTSTGSARARKFIIFCKDEAHLNEMEPIVKKWFKEALDDIAVKSYIVHSKEAQSDEQLEAFKNETSKDELHLLFSIDMLNEGLHVNEVSGVVLLRPTESPNIFYQQIGRCLKVGLSHQPVIFDFVNNFKAIGTHDFLYDLDFARKELLDRRTEEGLEDRCPRFDVNDEVRLISELFDEIQFKLDNWNEMYDRLVEFHKKFKHTDLIYTQGEDNTLYEWLRWQRKRKYHGKLEKEQSEKLEALGVDLSYQPIGSLIGRWEQQYQLLAKYKEEHRHCNVAYNKRGDNTLFDWVRTQRRRNHSGRMDKEQFKKLDALGLDWTYEVIGYLAERWEQQYQALAEYKNKHGNLNIPRNEKYAFLAQWAIGQRANFKKGKLDKDRVKKLEAIGFNFAPDDWQEKFDELRAYKNTHGHTQVTAKENKLLNGWANHQRENKRKGIVEAERIKKLESIGFAWNRRDIVFEQRFVAIEKFYKGHEHLNFPYPSSLYSWAINLRNRYKKEWLTPVQVQKLKNMGFDFTIRVDSRLKRDKFFEELESFYKKNGHIRVAESKGHAKLAEWLDGKRHQRTRGKLSKEDFARLDAMGMQWNKEHFNAKKWNKVYEQLVEYFRQNGTTFFEVSDNTNPELKTWCIKQRTHMKTGSMPEDRIAKLNKIGFAWSYDAAVWEERFKELLEFKKRYGHCRVTQTYANEYKKLFVWRSHTSHKLKTGKLSEERIKRLKAVGFE